MKIIWASYINEINNGDEKMKEIALNEMDKISEKYSRIGIFHHLAKFRDSRINDKIRNFINHEDYLTAYNARTSLGMETAEIIKREQIKNGIGTKKWWEI
jgi:5-methylcytosine-specific restriction endonuclease McrBC GTP-binding regulatory subunit McrB